MDHTPRRQDVPNQTSFYIYIYIYVLVRGLLLMLSHVVMDQVWKSAEAASPSHLPTSDLCFRTFSVAGSTHDTVLMLG